MTSDIVIYGDTSDDEELARLVFATGPLASAVIRRLPPRAEAPSFLDEFLRWERADWLVTRDERLIAAVEISRHGYTGDNGFQRFARIQRAASLHVPAIYFTPFSRTRLNEIEAGRVSPRNVAPEMFQALLAASEESGVPCLAVRWPTDLVGIPVPLSSSAAHDALQDLRLLVEGFAEADLASTKRWDWIPPEIADAMRAQAQLPFRVSETRFTIELPIDVESDNWIWRAMPRPYFSSGKADKILAFAALRIRAMRPLPAGFTTGFWANPGKARVLYLGYQWRPDPSSGLIAFAGVIARREKLPLIVIWPRVFLSHGAERTMLVEGLREFQTRGTGIIRRAGDELGLPTPSISRLRDRLNVSDSQFGIFTAKSKVGRILAENADLVAFSDGLYLPR